MKLYILIFSTTIFLLGFVTGNSFFYYLLSIKKIIPDISLMSGVLSVLGNVLGGLIGGIVAFAIAKFQFKNEESKRREEKNTVYLNFIRALLNELSHNKQVFKILCDTNSDKELYIQSLEGTVWEEIKYDANNFLPPNIYKLLDNQNREYKDLKEGILPEYEEKEEIDFNIRYHTTDKIINQINSIEKRLK